MLLVLTWQVKAFQNEYMYQQHMRLLKKSKIKLL